MAVAVGHQQIKVAITVQVGQGAAVGASANLGPPQRRHEGPGAGVGDLGGGPAGIATDGQQLQAWQVGGNGRMGQAAAGGFAAARRNDVVGAAAGREGDRHAPLGIAVAVHQGGIEAYRGRPVGRRRQAAETQVEGIGRHEVVVARRRIGGILRSSDLSRCLRCRSAAEQAGCQA